MKAPRHLFTLVPVFLALTLCLFNTRAGANSKCAIILPTAGSPGNFKMPSVNPASMGCTHGRLQAYFEDVDLSTKRGFADPVDGANRRACVCAVLSYIETVFQIDPSVTPANPLIIKFDAYAAPSTFLPMSLKATVSPNYPTGLPGFYRSYMGEGMIYGGAGLGTDHCGSILVNFGHPYAYCSGVAIGGCEEDFFGLILHEVSHLMGVCSSLDKDYIAGTVFQPMGPQTFTTFDSAFLYHQTSPGFLTKIVDVPSMTLMVPPPILGSSVDKVWLNGDNLSSTRTNQPIEDGIDIIPGVNVSYSHLVEDFHNRSWESPGFAPPYIMDWRPRHGLSRGKYSLQELRMFTSLGFSPNTSSGYADWALVGNSPPITLGQIIVPQNLTTGVDHLHLVQTPPAGNSDLYITTTNCHSVTIDLNAGGNGSISGWDPVTNSATSHGLGLSDPDPGSTLSVYDNYLWPITGCSDNLGHAVTPPLSLSGSVITFTPRPDFLGRARFGFHLGDGTERGSFIVITIDVEKDACFALHDACEYVINGGFEEGTDYNSYDYGTSSYNMPVMADNTSFMSNYIGGYGYVAGQILSDGTEPFTWRAPEILIPYSYTPTPCFGPVWSYYPGAAVGINSTKMTNPTTSAPGFFSPNKRYNYAFRAFNPGIPSTLAWDGDHNVTLHTDLIQGALYKLDFDYNFPPIGPTSVPASPSDPLLIYFTPVLYGSPFNLPGIPPGDIVSTTISYPGSAASGTWQSFTHTFTYGGALGNHFMRIAYDPGNLSPNSGGISKDNIQLRRLIIPAFTTTPSTACMTVTITGTVPGGNIVSWQWYDGGGSIIPGATSNVYTAPQYGSYTLEATDINGCKGSSTYQFNDPCPQFTADVSPRVIYPLSGTITSLPGIPGGNNAYYICGTLTINGPVPVNFTNDFVLCAPGSKIILNNGAVVTVDNSHFATCPSGTNMWKGIQLGTDFARIKVTGGSLIEDADTAIHAYHTAPWLFPTANLIETDNAVFNRNRVGIGIDDDLTVSCPYKFINTVFTSRNLNTYGDFKLWDAPATLKLPQTPLPPIHRSPYMLDKTSTYALANCKDGSMAHSGIYLGDCGTATPTSTFAIYNYTGITVGERIFPTDRNLFDFMRSGIEAHNSNLKVYNSTFMNMRHSPIPGTPSGGGDGIYSDATGGVITELNVTRDPNGVPHNEFYENQRGIQAYDNHDVLADYNYFGSSNTLVSSSGSVGFHGILLQSNLYNNLIVDHNTIDNHVCGVAILNNNDIGINGPAQIIATNNTVNVPTAPSGSAIHNQNIGILVDNIIPYYMPQLGYSSSIPWVDISSNHMNGVYNGISQNNFISQWNRINYNDIVMQEADNQLTQYGISNTMNSNIRVVSNTISSTGITNDNARAVGSADCIGPIVNCNTETNIARGFEFYGTNGFTNWLRNTMSYNGKALVLNNTHISIQTSTVSVPFEGCGNLWLAGTWGSGTWHTWMDNSLPSNSQLNIQFGANPDLVPTLNSGTPNFLPWIYKSTPTYNGINSVGSLYQFCGPYWHPQWRTASTESGSVSSSEQSLEASEAIAQDSIKHGYAYEDRRRWIAQMQLFTAIVEDKTMLDRSVILKSFYNMASGSRYAWLAQIQDSLAKRKTLAAASLINRPPAASDGAKGAYGVVLRDGPVGDSIISNYLAYFQLYLRWQGEIFGSNDSAELAGLALLCPHIHGPAIYQARTLLRLISKEYIPYSNTDCEANEESNQRLIPTGTTRQVYSLSPNPNDGSMQLLQRLKDEAPVSISVYNAVGAVVYSGISKFEFSSTVVKLNDISSGMYYMVLHDSEGKAYTLKFVKQ